MPQVGAPRGKRQRVAGPRTDQHVTGGGKTVAVLSPAQLDKLDRAVRTLGYRDRGALVRTLIELDTTHELTTLTA